MGIWLELGIFLVVIAWGFWQLYDVKQAKAQRIAEEARQAAAQAAQAAQESANARAESMDIKQARDANLPLQPA
jgi:type II secretory pathway component PulM